MTTELIQEPTFSEGHWRDSDGLIVCKCGKPAPLDCDLCDDCFEKAWKDIFFGVPIQYQENRPVNERN